MVWLGARRLPSGDHYRQRNDQLDHAAGPHDEVGHRIFSFLGDEPSPGLGTAGARTARAFLPRGLPEPEVLPAHPGRTRRVEDLHFGTWRTRAQPAEGKAATVLVAAVRACRKLTWPRGMPAARSHRTAPRPATCFDDRSHEPRRFRSQHPRRFRTQNREPTQLARMCAEGCWFWQCAVNKSPYGLASLLALPGLTSSAKGMCLANFSMKTGTLVKLMIPATGAAAGCPQSPGRAVGRRGPPCSCGQKHAGQGRYTRGTGPDI